MAIDEATFVAVHRRLRDRLERRLSNIVGATDAGDLVDEAFARAWAGRERFDPERGSIEAWVSGIARHLAADHLARRQTATRHAHLGRVEEEPAFEETSLDRIEALVALPALAAAIAELSTADGDLLSIVVGATLAGLSAGPLANAAHVRLHRLRRRLRRALPSSP